MNETPVSLSPDGEVAHLLKLRADRARAIRAEVPATPWLNRRQRAKVMQVVDSYIACAVGRFGRRSLARVVWPWTPRPTIASRAPRGRLSNPTALR